MDEYEFTNPITYEQLLKMRHLVSMIAPKDPGNMENVQRLQKAWRWLDLWIKSIPPEDQHKPIILTEGKEQKTVEEVTACVQSLKVSENVDREHGS